MRDVLVWARQPGPRSAYLAFVYGLVSAVLGCALGALVYLVSEQEPSVQTPSSYETLSIYDALAIVVVVPAIETIIILMPLSLIFSIFRGRRIRILLSAIFVALVVAVHIKIAGYLAVGVAPLFIISALVYKESSSAPRGGLATFNKLFLIHFSHNFLLVFLLILL